MDEINDTSASGYIEPGFEGVGTSFSEIETLRTSEFNVLARAKRYGKWWMLKGLNPEVAESTVHRNMLRKEFEMLMALSYPGVVHVAALEEVSGLGICIVQEYVEGTTLDKWAEMHPTKSERRHIVMELLDAVAYIHSCGIAHRDLKPSNIMVTSNGGILKIIDFGLADSARDTILKQPAGTRKYMSPEQAITSEADVRNDIYSIGIILNDLIACRRYSSIIGRCLLPIGERFQRVSDLKEALLRADKRAGILAKALTATLVSLAVIAIAAIGWLYVGGTAENVQKGTIDSLQAAVTAAHANIDSIKTISSAKIDSIQNAVNNTEKKLKSGIKEAAVRAQLVDTYIQKGLDLLELNWFQDLEHFEEASDKEAYVIEMINHQKQIIAEFYKEIKHELSATEAKVVNEQVSRQIIFYYYPLGYELLTSN